MMQLEIMRLYLNMMQEIYETIEKESLFKSGNEYEASLDQLATIRAHMLFTKSLIWAMEEAE